MKIEVSTGEIIDKLSILDIKLNKVKNGEKLKNIQTEYDELYPIYEEYIAKYGKIITDFYTDLVRVNSTLWDVEDEIRKCEANLTFDKNFIELARQVYYTNDKRADIKKKINIYTASSLVEEKEYITYI
jgi:hypothetical protein